MNLILLLLGLVAVGYALEIYLRWSKRRRERERENRENEVYGQSYAAPLYGYFSKADFRYIRLYSVNPERGAAPEYEFDSWGFRTDSYRIRFGEEPKRLKIIWLFGNSTAQGLGNRANETVPAFLNDRFAREGRPWRVVNAGMGGFASVQSLLMMIEMLHARRQPDAIVVYNGLREYARPKPGNCPPRSWFEWQRETEITEWLRQFESGRDALDRHALRYVLRRYLFPHALTSGMVRNSLRASRLAGRLGVPGAARLEACFERVMNAAEPSSPFDMATLQEWMVDRYLRNTRIIKGVADNFAIPCLHFHQPLLCFDVHYGLRKVSSAEERMKFDRMDIERRELIYSEAFAPALEKIAPGWIDLWDVFSGHDGEQLFSGPRHANGDGNHIIADAMFEHLLARNVLDSPCLER